MYCTFDKKPVYYYGGHLIEKGHLIKWWASSRNGGLLIEIGELLLGVGHLLEKWLASNRNCGVNSRAVHR